MKYLLIITAAFMILGCGDDIVGPNQNDGTVVNPTFFDSDGNGYSTVTIGNLEWTVQNLRATTYSCGTPIEHLPEAGELGPDYNTVISHGWATTDSAAYCYPNNTTNQDSISKYGALYNWYVINPDNDKSIAPEGWRVPTVEDWENLILALIAEGHAYDGSTDASLEENKLTKALASKTGYPAPTNWDESTYPGLPGYEPEKNNTSGMTMYPIIQREWLRGKADGFRPNFWAKDTDRISFCLVAESIISLGSVEFTSGVSIRLVRDVN